MSKSFTALSAVLAFGLCNLSVQAQPHGPAPQHPPMPTRPAPAGQYVVEGQVQRMLINPYGEVDGLRLNDGTIAKFPPHMAEALLAAVKVGDAVRVIGKTQTRGMVQAEAIVQTASGRTVYEQPPVVGEGRALPPHLRAQRLQTQKVEGRVDAVLTGPRGEANGVILSDGSIVRFPPESLRISVQPGAAFAASGMGTRNEFGTSLEAISMGTTLAALQPLYDRAQ